MKKGSLIVVSGFSGAGKGTLMGRLLKEYDNYVLSVSMTTRSPRLGEQDGREYFFVAKEEFEKAVQNNELLEHACYVNHYYGTPRKFVEQQIAEGKDVLLEIEVQGGKQIREKFPEAILLFVAAPSAAELKKRLETRNTETQEQIAGRLKQAETETGSIADYDYILVNDDLDNALKNMHRIIEAAKMTPCRNRDFIGRFGEDLRKLL